jgi:NifU-like protein involved in Fe-S cluster formation
MIFAPGARKTGTEGQKLQAIDGFLRRFFIVFCKSENCLSEGGFSIEMTLLFIYNINSETIFHSTNKFLERKGEIDMIYSTEVKNMCSVHQGVHHGAAPIPEEAKWVSAKDVKDISGYTHGIGWCAPQQGACKLSLNVKDGIIQEALVETIGCSGMTHSAAMASEILPGLTVLEALNTDLVCDAINTAMRELFLQIVYGRTQSAFSEEGLQIGAGLEDLGKGARSMVGTTYGTLAKGPRYLELTDGYITELAIDENDEIIGYKFVNFGKMMDFIKKGDEPAEALKKASGKYGRVDDAVKFIDPRKE